MTSDQSIVPEEVAQKYSNGWCMWLALALHERYGWRIRAQIQHYPPDRSQDYIAHAYCVTPDGREVDILGIQDRVDIFSTDEVRDFTPEDLLGYIGCDPASAANSPDMQDARVAVETYLSHLVAHPSPGS